MTRFAPGQSDLLALVATPAPPPPPARPPLEELVEILARLHATEHLPWPSLSVAMAEEQHMLSLARMAGAERKILAAAIMDEAERLFTADEHAAANACAPAGS